MGKQKDFGHVHHPSHKKKDKKMDKAVKPSRSTCQENFLKSIEAAVQAELDAIVAEKKIARKMQKILDRYPLLIKAVFLGSEQNVDNILDAGENINVQAHDGSTALIIAVENGFQGIVQKLLKKGADPKLLRQDGRNALMIAVSKNDNRSFTLIWNYWDKNNFWELNHSDSQGYTALTIAVELGHSQFTNFLLSLNGIEVDKQTVEGKTALMYAVLGGQVNVVQKLLCHGSDFVLENKDGATAICFAISRNQSEIKELFYECLDSKSRDMYVKKRIELLTRPRDKVNSNVIPFYTDILFRVILEIKRRFEDGVVLLLKYRVFAGLYKLLDSHQQETDLLRSGFHLTACLIYDKTDYSCYITEELAEQYISTKFADFTIKIMQNIRLKNTCEVRGAAFLCIHAGTQCRSGKTWLKTNYFQILPFVKEFNEILRTLTFWVDGESTKAKIMFERFLENLELVEKDMKIICSTSAEVKIKATESKSVPKSTEKDAAISTSELNNTSTATDDEWQLVSKCNPKNTLKTVGYQAVASTKSKKENKRKSKNMKLQSKLQNKIAAKKHAQRPNLMFNPDYRKNFPTLSSELKISETCYADALKRNLKNEEISYQKKTEEKDDDSKDIQYLLSHNETCSRADVYPWSKVKYGNNVEPNDPSTSIMSSRDETNMNYNSEDLRNSKNTEQQNKQIFYDLWKSSSNSEYPTDLMTIITNLVLLNAKKSEISNQNAINETSELSAVYEATTTMEHQKQSKALRDILAALGLKVDSAESDADARNRTKCKTETAAKAKSESAAMKEYRSSKEYKNKEFKNKEYKNKAISKFLYSDCLKHTSDSDSTKKGNTELKIASSDHVTENKQPEEIQKDAVEAKVPKATNKEQTLSSDSMRKENTELKNTTSSDRVTDKKQLGEIQKDTVKAKVFKVTSKGQILSNVYNKTLQKDEKMKSIKTDEMIKYSSIKDNEIQSSNESSSSNNMQNKSKIVENSDTSVPSNYDSTVKNTNKCFITSLKRKHPETYFRDLSFNFCREEIKEIEEDPSRYLHRILEYCNNSYRLIAQNKNVYFSKWNVNQNENFQKSRKEICCVINSNYYTNLFCHSSQTACSGAIQVIPKKSFNVISTGTKTYQDIPKKFVQQFPLNEHNIPPVRNLITCGTQEYGDVFYESEKLIDLNIKGIFSNFDFNCRKNEQNVKYSPINYSLANEKALCLPEIALKNLQRFMFIYKRMILYQVIDQPHLSLLYMNTRCVLPKTIFLEFNGKEFVTNCNDQKCFDSSHYQTGKINTGKYPVAIREEYKMLIKFKSNICNIISQLSTPSTKPLQKKSTFITKKGIGVTKVANKVRRSNAEMCIPKETGSNDTSFTFCNDTYGYKPKFINCEPRSRWYGKLHTIEECVPLAAFLCGFGQVERSRVLHELVSPTGKIVFSSKEEHILRKGEFGTHIGLMNNGNPVVVRTFPKKGVETIELLSSKRRLHHKNLVIFYYFCSSQNDQRYFTVTELVEYCLPEYMKTKMIQLYKNCLIQDLVDAIYYLHKMGVVHGFLKPSNVMVTIDDRLKVSGFYQLGMSPAVYGIVRKQNEKPAPIGSSAVTDYSWRPYELIAATTEKDVRTLLTKASDIHMTGMLIYYILSYGKHPFGSSDLRCQENIRNGFPEFGPRPSDIESRDLVRDMIKRIPSQRLIIEEVLKHPYLWNIVRRFQFLVDVARKIKFFARRPTKIAEALQDSCIEARDWTCYVHPQLLNYVSKWMNKTYANNYADLLHFMLNINDNFEILPQELKDFIGHPSYFISRTFPTVFMSVYSVVRDNPFVQQQMALQAYF